MTIQNKNHTALWVSSSAMLLTGIQSRFRLKFENNSLTHKDRTISVLNELNL